MPFAVELCLDPAAEARVRTIWKGLDENGVCSLGGAPDSSERPHVSLAAFDAADLEAVEATLLAPLKECIGLRLTLASLGFFLTEEGVAFLGVVPTASFLGVQRRVFRCALPGDLRLLAVLPARCSRPALQSCDSGYGPQHCHEDRAGADLPIEAVAASAHLLELPGAISRFQVTAS